MKHKLFIFSCLIVLFIFTTQSVLHSNELGQWIYTSPMNQAKAEFPAVSYNNHIYAIGGQYYLVPFTSVEKVDVNSDGTLSAWSYCSSLNYPRMDGKAFTWNGYIYILAGESDTSMLSTIEQATVYSDGSLGAWKIISNSGPKRQYPACVTNNNFIYLISGWDGYSVVSTVIRAQINSDGSLGSWSNMTSYLNTGRTGLSASIYNGYIYIEGGFDENGGGGFPSVERAMIYPDGNLGPWVYISSPYYLKEGGATTVVSGYIYTLGGSNDSTVERAQIFPDGDLGDWQYVNSMKSGNAGFGAVTLKNNIYVIGGANGYSETSSVEYATVLVYPPTFPSFPNLKLFSNQSIYHAFNLEDFNTGDMATTYSILSNFQDLSSLDSSSVNQNAYSSPTTGMNIYLADNAYGEGTASNEVKYSTYKIYKLPKIGLTVGSSWDVGVAGYTYNSSGLAIPPSFGNPEAINVSDTTLVSATWLGNTAIHIISLQAFSGAVDVEVTASPNATSPYGSDIDVERIQVYTNLLTHSTFSTANDTSIWMPLELAPGRTTLATQGWISTYMDSAGTLASGVWKFTFGDGNSGVKSTPKVSTWLPMSNGQWYTLRMRVVADTPNNAHQSALFGFNNYVGTGLQTDISVNMLFGIPTVWTWQETPMLVHSSSTTGYPQFIFKASTSGNIYIDEIQIINSAPTLVDANRGNTRWHYTYGEFNQGTDTTGWGGEVYYGAGSLPGISVANNALVLDFSNASSGTGQKGIKWTANNGVQGVGAGTFPVTMGRQVGVRGSVAIQSGTFNSLGVILVAGYGVQTSGQQDIGVASSNLIASAEVGILSSGTYRTVANAVNPFYQFQFGIRSDQSGVLSVTNVDLDIDQDDPNFGDASLFPE